jgi:hypothetical protein
VENCPRLAASHAGCARRLPHITLKPHRPRIAWTEGEGRRIACLARAKARRAHRLARLGARRRRGAFSLALEPSRQFPRVGVQP